MARLRAPALLALLALTTAAASPAPRPPRTRYLLVGGGSEPASTQVSLEEHLLRLGAILDAAGSAPERRALLFADGASTHPVVEENDAAPKPDALDDDLALVLDATADRKVTWRPTTLTGIGGPADRAHLRAALASPGRSDRTFLYFAGHGFQRRDGAEVTLGLWGGERLRPDELTAYLSKLPDRHRVAVVLTQCHAGGFANLVYKDADRGRGLASQDRCGFFAAPADEVAAGCTAEARRRQPDDYSAWFLAALSGKLASGAPLPESPDANGDRAVGLDEAHAFARRYDGTIDVPISTSEHFLRSETALLPPAEGLTLASPLEDLLAAARPGDRAVIAGLARAAGLERDPAAALKARYHADRLRAERARLQGLVNSAREARNQARLALRTALVTRWPWLENAYHPRNAEVRARDAAAIGALLREGPLRATLRARQTKLREASSALEAADRAWARWERLARAAEVVVHEAQLRAQGTPPQLAKLEAILRCEADPL